MTSPKDLLEQKLQIRKIGIILFLKNIQAGVVSGILLTLANLIIVFGVGIISSNAKFLMFVLCVISDIVIFNMTRKEVSENMSRAKKSLEKFKI